MLRLDREQRIALGEILGELANLVAAALVLGQFVGSQGVSWQVLLTGLIGWMLFVAVAIALAKGGRS